MVYRISYQYKENPSLSMFQTPNDVNNDEVLFIFLIMPLNNLKLKLTNPLTLLVHE